MAGAGLGGMGWPVVDVVMPAGQARGVQQAEDDQGIDGDASGGRDQLADEAVEVNSPPHARGRDGNRRRLAGGGVLARLWQSGTMGDLRSFLDGSSTCRHWLTNLQEAAQFATS